MSTHTAAAAPSLLTPPPPVHDLRGIRDDVVQALIEQGFKRADATTAGTRSDAVTFAGMFQDGLQWLQSQRSTGRVQAQPPTLARGRRTDPMPKICNGFKKKCSRELADGNKSGLCASCAVKKAKTLKKANGNAHVEPIEKIPTIQLAVREEMLDRLFQGMPIEDKARLVQGWLDGQ
jgi:hypothetical protein